MANVISSYTAAGTHKGTKSRAAEKKASATLRAKAKGRKTETKKSTLGKISSAAKSTIKKIEEPFPAQNLGGRYTYQSPKKTKKK